MSAHGSAAPSSARASRTAPRSSRHPSRRPDELERERRCQSAFVRRADGRLLQSDAGRHLQCDEPADGERCRLHELWRPDRHPAVRQARLLQRLRTAVRRRLHDRRSVVRCRSSGAARRLRAARVVHSRSLGCRASESHHLCRALRL